MAREINRIAGGVENVAEDGLIDVIGGDAGAIDRVFGCENGKIDGGRVLELAAEGAERGADGGKEDYAGRAGRYWHFIKGSERSGVTEHCQQSARSVVPSSQFTPSSRN